MNDDFDIEDVLRASLAEHAREAPPADPLAERIIDEADHPLRVHDPRGPRRWRGWMPPAVAAASVVAVVATILGLVQLKHSGKHAADPDHRRSHPASSAPSSGANPSLYGSGQPTASVSASVSNAGLPGGAPVPEFRVIDLTFINTKVGWALGNGKCLDGSPGICPAVMRTDDGGGNWVSTLNPPAPLPAKGAVCGDPCVNHLRFANQDVGYAFGPGVLFMTTDGGQSWGESEGDTSSLEVANDTALRVTGDQLQVATVGKTSWKPATLPGKATVRGPVVRALDRAYVPAATSDTIYKSLDDGRHWTTQQGPCPSSGVLASMSAGADGSVAIMCLPTDKVSPQLFVSDADGANFKKVANLTKLNLSQSFGAANSSTVFRSSPGRLDRSTDGGQHWKTVASDTTTGGQSFLGFESESTGRWVTGDGSRIYTTTDGGKTWKYYYFK